ncbi:alpha-L-fucosidase [Lachnospiraceae bacterium KM106-2]|nr:alpha-L-fucosidase [Lachnospiraceae bacterium KM106-2]
MEKEKYLREIHEVIANGPYNDTWSSLSEFEIPSWFLKAKFGIFIHWGLYSIAAHNNEWYSRNMYRQDKEEYEYHRKTFGDHKTFGYKDFIPLFKAERFDPSEWAELIKEAGAKYVCPVAEHHDGFQMYQSELSKYNAKDMGPHRDILGELKTEFEKRDLKFCTSSHRAEHWFFMGHGKHFDSDVKEPLQCGDFYWPSVSEQPDEQSLYSKPYPNEEFLTDWLLRTCEIIDRYQPKILYFDWWVQHEAFKPTLRKIAAYYYNKGAEWGIPTAICYKHDAMAFGSGIVDIERGKFSEAKAYHWQTDTAVAKNSWCYTTTLDYKTSYEIICYLIDVVSKNGNVLLNIGPKGDGSIPDGDKKILKDIGSWLSVNGEGIYNSKVFRVAEEGPTKEEEGQFQDQAGEKVYTSEDFRFTVANGCIYAYVLHYPENGEIRIKALADSLDQNKPHFHGIIRSVEILGFDEVPEWETNEEYLSIRTKDVRSDMPVGIKIVTD